ncbi:hypothetical protein F4808DRAFT_312375 [Astrocystis sublimbata]|nr:hypothetical protein F4808DRAFT_312375 [Astrocystis sublimbata]
MDSQHSPTPWPWEDDESWRRSATQFGFSLPYNDHPYTSTQPAYRDSHMKSTQVDRRFMPDTDLPSHGLPAPSSLPIMNGLMIPTNNFEYHPERQQGFSQPSTFQPTHKRATKPDSGHKISKVPGHSSTAPHPSRKRLEREKELKDEAYPMRLVRELDRSAGKQPRIGKGKPVFCVVHINDPIDGRLVVDNVSTYTTVQAANDRGLDFWHRKYGTKMFTQIEDTALTSIKHEHIEECEKHSNPASGSKKPKVRFSGGVPSNRSHWAIKNGCLSLSHTSGREDRIVYVEISYVQDHGIHD